MLITGIRIERLYHALPGISEVCIHEVCTREPQFNPCGLLLELGELSGTVSDSVLHTLRISPVVDFLKLILLFFFFLKTLDL
jgi:hypothetical protein